MLEQIFGDEWTLDPGTLLERWADANGATGSKGWLFREVGTDRDPWVIEILQDCTLWVEYDAATGEMGTDLRP